MRTQSVGLVVVTGDDKVVLIKRRVPYSFEHFLLKRKIPINEQNIIKYVSEFKACCLRNLNIEQQQDFIDFFYHNKNCEDQFDFPHGNLKRTKDWNNISENTRYENSKLLFESAMREFEEETGKTFELNKAKILPKISVVNFKGLDNVYYKQFYFTVIVDKVFDAPKPGESQYETIIVSLDEGQNILSKQQEKKRDDKHLLIKMHKKQTINLAVLNHLQSKSRF